MGVEKDFDTLDTSEQLDSTGGTLEEYGVWVKSGPEDIDDTTDNDSFSLENLPEIEGSTSFLTEEEESLLGDLETGSPEEDDEETEESRPEMTEFGKDDSVDEDFSLEDLDDMSDFESIEEENSETEETAPTGGLSLDEDIFTIDTPEDSFADEDTEEETSLQEEDELFEPEFEDTDKEELETRVSATEEEDFFDLDLDNIEEESAESGQEEAPSFDEDEFEAMSLDDDTGLSELSETSESVFSDEPEEISLDELEQDEEELPELSVEDLMEENIVSDEISSDLDTKIVEKSEVLRKIEEELHSIRDELASLKSELSSLKIAPASTAAGVTNHFQEEDEDRLPSFFEEDEDETIALTGDELDNILNTADVTEEAGKASEGPEEELDIDISSIDGDLSENFDISALDTEDAELDLSGLESSDETEGETDFLEPEIEEDELELSDLSSEEELDISTLDTSYEEPEEEEEGLDLSESGSEGDDFENLDITAMDDLEDLEEDLDLSLPESLDEADEETEDSLDEGDLEFIDNPEEHLGSDSLLDGEDILDIEDEDTASLEEPAEEPDNTETEDFLSLPEEETGEPDFADLELEDLDPGSEDAEPDNELSLGTDEEETADYSAEPEEIELDISPEDSQEMAEIVEVSEEEAEFPENEILDLGGEEIGFEAEEDTGDDFESIEEDELISEEPVDAEDFDAGDTDTDDTRTVPQSAEKDKPEGLKLNPELQSEIKSVLSYMDQLLEALPENKIEEFARSEHFKVYQKLFDELGISS